MAVQQEDMETLNTGDFLDLTSEIVSAYVSDNKIEPEQLPSLIENVYKKLIDIAENTLSEAATPAVPIKKSVTPDYIICLEDGKKFKMMRRHLSQNYGLSPDEYRAKWGLPSNYPMVAPNYAKKRSKLAKDIGLGIRK